MHAHEILTEAASVVAGARNASHGDKERSFVVIANLWNAYVDGRKAGGAMTPRDVAQMMALLKIGRSIQGSAAPDHFLDEAGYAAIAGELAACESADAPAASVAPMQQEDTAPVYATDAIIPRWNEPQYAFLNRVDATWRNDHSDSRQWCFVKEDANARWHKRATHA